MTMCLSNETAAIKLAERDNLVGELVEALKEGRRAIGSHVVPDHCYATGPKTGDEYRDLVECPACSFIAMFDRVIAKAREGAQS